MISSTGVALPLYAVYTASHLRRMMSGNLMSLSCGLMEGNAGSGARLIKTAMRRNTKAARRLLVRLLKKQGVAPKRMITNKLRSYGSANDSSSVRRRLSVTDVGHLSGTRTYGLVRFPALRALRYGTYPWQMDSEDENGNPLAG
jgi:hypothetical protein